MVAENERIVKGDRKKERISGEILECGGGICICITNKYVLG